MDYDIALFIHIAGVVALVVAAALELTSLIGLRHSASVAEARTWASLTRPLEVVFPVSAVVIIGAGLYMLHSGYATAQPWAMTVLVLLVILAIFGAGFNGPNMVAIHHALETAPDGPVPDDIARRINNPALYTSIQTMSVMILGAVLLMTVKPGLRDSLIAVAVFAILGIASSRVAMGRQRAPSLAAAVVEPATPEP